MSCPIAGDVLLLHDGHSARASSAVPVFLAVLPRVLDARAAQGLTPVTPREGTT